MEKFKNFIYDKSDLLIALLIVLIAGAVISFGVSNIMEPYVAGTNAGTDSAITESENGGDPALAGAADVGSEDPDFTTNYAIADGTKTPEPMSIIIREGESSEQIAGKLIEAGAITKKTDFYEKLKEMGMESRLQPGSFEIPAGTSMEEIIRILTKTN